MKRLILTTVASIAAAGACTTGALAAGSDEPAAAGVVATARAATARFHDIDAAIRAGYVGVSDCVSAPGVGTMGPHYLNPAYASDDVIDAAKPEILVYAPRTDGSLRLVAVEYFKADADQDLATDDDRPTLGGVAFDGPMDGHSEGMPIHYDLHAWVWAHNPAGTLAQYNPRLSC